MFDFLKGADGKLSWKSALGLAVIILVVLAAVNRVPALRKVTG